jgi:hypothetical protein
MVWHKLHWTGSGEFLGLTDIFKTALWSYVGSHSCSCLCYFGYMDSYVTSLCAEGQKDLGLIPGREQIFLFSHMSKLGLGPTQRPIQCVSGCLYPGVKWLGHVPDHWSPSSIMGKNAWSCTCIFSYLRALWLFCTFIILPVTKNHYISVMHHLGNAKFDFVCSPHTQK